MKKIILGILIGLITWGSLLSVSDYIWAVANPTWFGKYFNELQAAIYLGKPFTPQKTILIIVILRSILSSIISGFVTATVAFENYFSNLILGILLILCGYIVHLSFWDLVPYWFHFLIFFQFIPFTMLGGRLIKVAPDYPKFLF